MLIVADNSSDAGQVRALVPGGRAHRLLVTSRDTLTGLDARLPDVDELAPAAAVEPG
ncbi:hypothetical protein [Actinomadura decatromicini]|uniref:hypothetical protein n=1 Tax=Actinomadura decatromicini TaxID=2604572 RepID=UPI001652DD25|nr:hypothetical protein [Actinomadura decatromicini]